jgi:Short C-terminal domain
VTVGKISLTCWIVFVVMCVAFLPLGAVIIGIHALPAVVRVVLAVLVVGGLWWGPFAYGMYLSMAAVKNGDRRLLKRGKAGTAVVLSANKTNEVIQSGEFAWEAPRVYKYRLRVTVPGRSPYETDCRICATGLRAGSVVNVAVSPHNRKRVTIDVGQGSKGGTGAPGPVPGARTSPAARTLPAGTYPAGRVDVASGVSPVTYTRPSSPDAQRISDLTQLGQLHSQGVLTDAEFAAEKARILGE